MLLSRVITLFTAGHSLLALTEPLSERRFTPGIWSYFCYPTAASFTGDQPYGYYSDFCWKMNTEAASKPATTVGWLLMLKWSHVETAPGVYDWSALDANITKAAKLDLDLQIMMEIVKVDHVMHFGATPAWLYEAPYNVPIVQYKKGNESVAPYYLDATFQKRFTLLIQAYVGHLCGLPKESRDAVWAVQIAVGITGDSRPWNGVPLNPTHVISSTQWKAYCDQMILVYLDALASCSNPDKFDAMTNVENGGENQTMVDSEWAIHEGEKRGIRVAVKQGLTSHGYQLNGEKKLYFASSVPELLTPRDDGTYTHARGELALQPTSPGYGNWIESPGWSIQANAEWMLHSGVDIWNIYSGWFLNKTYAPTFAFFNRNAGQKSVTTATNAFIRLRESLNIEDVAKWPTSVFGKVNITNSHGNMKMNVDRVYAICNATAVRGCANDDVKCLLSFKSVVQKKCDALNDVCYECWEGNYERYMSQVNASATSVGWWRVGPRNELYGRFARGLDQKKGKARISIDVDNKWASVARKTNATLHTVNVRVAYFDLGTGEWSLLYADGSGTSGSTMATALTVKKKDSGHWKVATATFALPPAGGRGFPGGKEDLALLSLTKRDDPIFSLIEIELQ